VKLKNLDFHKSKVLLDSIKCQDPGLIYTFHVIVNLKEKKYGTQINTESYLGLDPDIQIQKSK